MDKIKELFVGWKTVPNFLSFIRIILVPVFAVLFYKGHHVAAIIVLVVSGLTDFADGKIARRFNQISALGKILDPVADKITQLTLATLLFIEFHNSENTIIRAFGWVFLVFLVKEFIFVAGGALMIALGMMPGAAEIYGKVATFAFYVVVTVLFLFAPTVGVFTKYFELPEIVCGILVCLSALMTIIAFISYIPGIASTYREHKAEKNAAKE